MNLIVLLFISVVPQVAFASLLTLQVKPLNYVFKSEGQSVTLADIILKNQKNSSLIEKHLMAVKLGAVTKAGETITFTSAALAGPFRRISNDLKDEGISVKLKIPSRVRVKNLGRTFTGETVATYLAQKMTDICDPCRVQVKGLRLPALHAEVASEKWHIHHLDRLPKGNFSVPVTFAGTESRFWIKGEARIFKQVPVTLRSLKFGERLSAEDFKVEYRDVTFATDAPADKNNLEGRQARLTLKADQEIWQNSLAREKALIPGQPVKLKVEGEEFSLILMAVAQQGGFIGDQVKVMNLETRKLLVAKITGKGEAVLQ